MRPNATQRPGPKGGFTTVELLVGLTLTGITLAIGVQKVDGMAWRLDAAARDVGQRVRTARALAVLKQHDVVVTFDMAESAVVLHEDANNDGIVNGEERVTRYYLEKGIEFTRASAPAYAGFDGGPVTFAGQKVTFMRNGSASEEGAVYVAKVEGERARAIIVSRATGYTDIYRYNGTAWSADE